jgi:hypothetical protein
VTTTRRPLCFFAEIIYTIGSNQNFLSFSLLEQNMTKDKKNKERRERFWSLK